MNPRALDRKTRLCPICHRDLPVNSFNKRVRSGRPTTAPYCKLCTNLESIRRQRLFKQKCVDYKGGSCIKCTYDKCLAALEFHHRDPNEKDFSISKVLNHQWNEWITQELDKCDLLCSNCHREIHASIQADLERSFLPAVERIITQVYEA